MAAQRRLPRGLVQGWTKAEHQHHADSRGSEDRERDRTGPDDRERIHRLGDAAAFLPIRPEHFGAAAILLSFGALVMYEAEPCAGIPESPCGGHGPIGIEVQLQKIAAWSFRSWNRLNPENAQRPLGLLRQNIRAGKTPVSF